MVLLSGVIVYLVFVVRRWRSDSAAVINMYRTAVDVLLSDQYRHGLQMSLLAFEVVACLKNDKAFMSSAEGRHWKSLFDAKVTPVLVEDPRFLYFQGTSKDGQPISMLKVADHNARPPFPPVAQGHTGFVSRLWQKVSPQRYPQHPGTPTATTAAGLPRFPPVGASGGRAIMASAPQGRGSIGAAAGQMNRGAAPGSVPRTGPATPGRFAGGGR
jgi:hypothetical protein